MARVAADETRAKTNGEYVLPALFMRICVLCWSLAWQTISITFKVGSFSCALLCVGSRPPLRIHTRLLTHGDTCIVT